MKGLLNNTCRLYLILASLILFSNTAVAAPIPTTDLNDLAATEFVGEQFCFDVPFSNSGGVGDTGFGPYLQLQLPPELTYDSATFIGSPVVSTDLGQFPPDITDPLIDSLVTGPNGYRLITLQPPIGSIVIGGPALDINICTTIDANADIGVPLPVTVTPVFQYGDTATGDNGALTGATVSANVIPGIVKFEKVMNAPEGERPPGPSWPITYELVIDIANGKTIYDLDFSDVLPADLAYVANSISITGGTACNANVAGQSIAYACTEATGTTSDSDVVVTYQAFVTDVLDEAQCDATTIINTATFNANRKDASNNDVALGPLTSMETVTSSHVEMQKSVTPGIDPAFVSPGDTLTYTVNIQTTEYDDLNNLVLTDVLPDGLNNFTHSTITLDGTPIAVVPTITTASGVITVTYDIGAIVSPISSDSSIEVIYTADIKETYDNGDNVKASDVLTNSASVDYGLSLGANSCTDSSSATAEIIPLNLTKSIVNPQAEYQPGDDVIFRLSMEIPSGDTSGIVFEDFFPLPVFKVSDLDLTYGTGDISVAATDTLGLTPTSITIDANSNKLTIAWPDVNTTTTQALAVDVTLTVSSDPFADNISLSNLFQAATNNTPLTSIVDLSLVGIKVGAPELVITKGVASSDGNGTVSPAPASPNDSDLTDADASDEIIYEITVENIGGAPAYNVVISDDLGIPTSLLESCSVATVTDGAGTNLTYTTAATFDGIVNLTDPLAANDENPAGGGSPFTTDTAIVKIKCSIAQSVEPSTEIINTASATWTAGSAAGSTAFPAEEDTASVTINKPSIVKNLVTAGSTFTIGDIIRYEIVISVPELTINNVVLTDTLDAGLAFVDFTQAPEATITSSNGNVVNSVFTPTVTASGTNLSLDLGTIVNGNTGNSGTDTITIAYDVVVLNTTAINAGGTKNNSASLVGDNYSSETVSANNITISEPNVVVEKTVINPSSNYDAGDTVTYQWHVFQSGSNLSDAFDVALSDTLPANVSYVAGSLQVVGACPNITLDDTNAPTLTASWTTFAVADDCNIQYSVTLDSAVAAGSNLDNTVDITWTSQAGVVAGPLSIYNADSCERTSASDPNKCGTGNDYDDTSSASITIDEVVIKKKIVGTSEASTTKAEHGTGTPDLAIGETVTFRLTVTIPEGTSEEITVTDNLPANSVGVMEYVFSTIVSTGANLAPAIGNPAPVISDANLADGINDKAVWSFGQVVNSGNNTVDAEADQIVIEITGRFVDVGTNTDGKNPRNRSSVRFGTSLTDTSNRRMDIVEPKLQIDKTSTTTTADGGDTVTYTIEISHTAASTQEAFDVVLTDIVPAGMTYDAGTFQLVPSASCTVAPVINDATPETTGLTAIFDSLPKGNVCQFTFDATLNNTVNPNQTITNQADLIWDTLPADNDPNERSYAANDDHEIKVTIPGLEKIVFATSEASNDSSNINGPETDLTIGEKVTYRFTTTIPEGQTDNVVIIDQLPTAGIALELVSSRIVSIGSQLTLGAAVNDAGDDCLPAACDSNADNYRDKAQWDLATIVNAPDGSNNADDEIVFEVIALVVDDNTNSGGADDKINTATMAYTGDGGNLITGTVAIDLIEPVLNISKQALPATSPYFADAGDVITFELTVEHDAGSTADAFNVNIEDTLANDGSNVLMNWVGNVGGTCGATTNSANATAIPPKIVFNIPVMALATASCTITYDVSVDILAEPGQTLTNNAAMQYDSTPVYVAGETRRSTDSASSEVVINAPALVKVVSSTTLADTQQNEHNAANEDLTIGEQVTYSITLKLPEGTTQNVVLTDAMPTGANGVIEFIGTPVISFSGASSNISVTSTTVTNSGPGGFTLDLGTVTNIPDNIDSADDLITITVTGVVKNLADNVDGKMPVNTATLSYTGGPDLTDTAAVDIVEPDMAINKSMTVNNGVAAITVALTNNGTASAYDIEITDNLDSANWDTANIVAASVPAGFTLTTSGLNPATIVMASDPGVADNDIDVGETKTFVFTVPVQPGISSIANTATNTVATTIPGTDANERDEPDVSDTATLGIPLIELKKEAAVLADTNGDSEVGGVGDKITYNFTVENTGGVDLTNVTVTDNNALVTVTGNPISLVVGETDSISITAEYIITQADMDAGIFENIATVTANGPTGSVTDDSDDPNDNTDDDVNGDGEPDDPTIVTLPRTPSMAVTKTTPTANINAPSTISYSITVENDGNVTLTDLALTDTLPDTTGGTLTGPTGDNDSDGDLDVGETWTYTASYDALQADIDAGSTLTNSISVTSAEITTAVEATADTTIIQSPAMTVSKSTVTANLAAPATISYTVTIENTGNVTLTNVTPIDTLPDTNNGVLTGPTGDANADGKLDITETWTYTASYDALQADIDAGSDLTNNLSVTTTEITTAETAQAVTTITQNPSIEVIKTITTSGSQIDDVVEFSISVQNTGNVTLSNVTLADTLMDANSNPLSLTSGPSFVSADNGSSEGTLKPNETATYTATYKLTQSDIDAGGIANSVDATGTPPNSGTAVTDTSDDNDDADGNTEDDPTVLNFAQTPSISLEKTAATLTDTNGDGIVSGVGDVIQYNFTVKNTGNVTLSNITVADIKATVTGGPITLLPGASDTTTFTATYTISAADVAATEVINTATVNAKDPSNNDVSDVSDDPNDPANNDTNGNGNPDDPTVTKLEQLPIADDETQHNPTIGTTTTVDVVNGDVDPDGSIDASTVSIISNDATDTDGDGDDDQLIVPGEGVWNVDNATGEITFTPLPSFQGDPTPINYTVDDNNGNTSNVASVTVTYGKPPVTDHDSQANQTLGTITIVDVLANDQDTDGGTLDPATVQILGTANPGDPLVVPGEGTWTVDTATGTISFMPEAGYTGDPTPIQYTVDDNDGNVSNPSTVTVTYGDAPIATDDSLHNPVIGTPTELDILNNDNDPDGSLVPATVQIVGTANPGDSLVIAGEGEWKIDPATGKITFIPELGFKLNPTPIQYTVDDDAGNTSNPATVRVTYGKPPLASPDGAANPVIGTPTTVDLVNNDNDLDGTIVDSSVKIVNPPAGTTLSADGKTLTVPGEGVWLVDATGKVTFTPESGFSGDPTSIEYTIEDNDGNVSEPATVTVTYGEPPEATDNIKQNPVIGSPTEVDVVGNDNDADGTLDPTSVQIVGTTNPGDPLIVAGQGEWKIDSVTGKITFTPEAGYTGDPDPIQYTVKDNDGNLSNTATVTVTYGKPPVANNDTKYNPVVGSPTTVNLVSNDNDPDGTLDLGTIQLIDPVSGNPVSSVTTTQGTWLVNPGTGTVTFTPASGFIGDPDPIQYIVKDNDGNLSNQATITVSYGESPIANDDNSSGNTPATAVTINPVGNDNDPENQLDPTSVKLIDPFGNPVTTLTVPGQGVWTVDPSTGEITFTPTGGFTGDPDPVTYTIKDIDGNESNTAKVTIDYQQDFDMSLSKAMSNNADGDSSGSITVDDILTYTVTTTNTGNANLTNVTVTDSKITPSSTSCATLAPLATCVLTGTYQVTQADVDAGQINNTASTTSSERSDVPDTTITTPVATEKAITLVKVMDTYEDLDGTGTITEGDILQYQITATNTGTTTLTEVFVEDLLLFPVTEELCYVLLPQDTCLLVGQYTVSAEDVALGEYVNTATVYSDQTNPVSTTHTVIVLIANEPPIAVNDISTGNTAGTAVTINPLSNDSDPDNQLDPTSVRLVDGSGNPVTSLVVAGEGTWTVDTQTGEITFTPIDGFDSNPTPISYTVKDVDGEVSNSATVTIVYAQTGSLNLVKTGYAGHDAGQRCSTVEAKDDIILIDIDGSKDEPVTYCFEVTNTGSTYLTDITLTDNTLGVTHQQLTLLNGPVPTALQAGASLVFYYEAVATASISNTASVVATPADSDGNPTGNAGSSSASDTAELALVVDPPSGIKTVTPHGNTGMQWQMIWINDSVINAPNVTVFDEIPAGTHFESLLPTDAFGNTSPLANVSSSGVYCETRGTSTTNSSFDNNCYFEAPSTTYPRGRIVWKGVIASDPGLTTENTANNEVVIRFVTVLDNPSQQNQSIVNQATSAWDFDNNGNTDISVPTDNPLTADGEPDATTFTPANSIPTLSEWMLLLLALLLLAYGKREDLRRVKSRF